MEVENVIDGATFTKRFSGLLDNVEEDGERGCWNPMTVIKSQEAVLKA